MGLHVTQCGLVRGLPPCRLQLDPFNRLATIHQRHRQAEIGHTGPMAYGKTLQTVAQKRFVLCYRTVVCMSICLSVMSSPVCDVGT